MSIVKGFRKQKAIEENSWRKIYGLLVMINRDPKKPIPQIEKQWSIPIIDNMFVAENENIAENTDIKGKLLKAWRLN